MPEGDTVFLAARRLSTALSGKTLTVSDFRVPELATTDLTGRAVLDVVARGKHLLTRIEGGLTVHTHFRMEGSFRLFRPGQRWTGGPAHQIRLVLGNDTWQAVGYRLPVVELVATHDESSVVGHLGPDVLGADWDLDRAVRNIASEPTREIGNALLDQRMIAGIGNIYRTEALFLRGISPWTPVAAVADLPALVSSARRLMLANRDVATQSTTGSTRRGETTYVYSRAGRVCRRCHGPIRRADQGEPGVERVTYWCPVCQPGPGPSPGRLTQTYGQPPRRVRRTFQAPPGDR